MNFILPSPGAQIEPIFGGFLPEASLAATSANYDELIHKHEDWVNAEYFPNADTDKKIFARNVRKFILSSIKFKEIKIPLQSKITCCEIIYKDFAIHEIRLSCTYPFSYNLNGEIEFREWFSETPPASLFDEDYNFSLNFSPGDEYYFVYHLLNLMQKPRIYVCCNVPVAVDELELKDKEFWSLPW